MIVGLARRHRLPCARLATAENVLRFKGIDATAPVLVSLCLGLLGCGRHDGW
jgi:hypothetical protein